MSTVECNPPLFHHYGTLPTYPSGEETFPAGNKLGVNVEGGIREVPSCQLPVIDVGPLLGGGNDHDGGGREGCMAAITAAASEWGFFQVVNHGVSPDLLQEMRREQVRLFQVPFEKKAAANNDHVLNKCYTWGTPTATCPNQFSWSEAFHIPLSSLSTDLSTKFNPLRETIERFVRAMSGLGRCLAGVLAESLGPKPKEAASQLGELIGDESSCFLRLNRYPPCTMSQGIFGLVPHTDSDFLTILHQDQVGGLQLKKDSTWVAVIPNNDALIVNVGDLFQAWSNDVYKSVEHKVMVNDKVERYSVAYFMCPANDSLIGSCREPSVYRKFTFGEYKRQVKEDVKRSGHKVGLPRFLPRSK